MKPKSPQPSGFTLIELVLVVTLLTFLVASTYNTFMTGQSLWTKVDRAIELEDNLRRALDRIVPELAMSGHDSRGFFQASISNNNGVHGSDILRFSIPVICESNGNPVNAQGNAAHWGAPLTWGCTEASCMDADNNCDTVDYKYIEYLINGDALIRRVLDYSQAVVREETVALNISDFQAEPNFNQRIITLTLTGQLRLSGENKVTAQTQSDVYLRNSR